MGCSILATIQKAPGNPAVQGVGKAAALGSRFGIWLSQLLANFARNRSPSRRLLFEKPSGVTLGLLWMFVFVVFGCLRLLEVRSHKWPGCLLTFYLCK